MKLNSVKLYETKASREDFKGSSSNNPYVNNSNSNSAESILKEISILIYNQSFTIKEEKDCLKLYFVYASSNKVIELKRITQNDSNKENECMIIINKLTETIDKQNDTIAKLEKNEIELLNRVSTLEKVIKNMSDTILQIKQPESNTNPIVNSKSQAKPIVKPQQHPQQYNSAEQHMRYRSNTDQFYNLPNEITKFDLINKNDYSILYNKQSKTIKTTNEIDMICNWINTATNNTLYCKLILIYQGSRQGFSATQFHNCCDDANSTLTIIQTDYGLRFGGFTTQSWKGEECYKADPSAFLFTIDNMKKYPIRSELSHCAIYCRSNNLALFGNGYDLAILDKTKNFQSLSNFPINYGGGKEDKFSLTGGKQQFNVAEIETYMIDYCKSI